MSETPQEHAARVAEFADGHSMAELRKLADGNGSMASLAREALALKERGGTTGEAGYRG